MESLIFPIFVAFIVALFVWAVIRLVFGTGDDRKRVSQRLSDDGKNYTVGGPQRSSILIQSELTGLARALATKTFFQKVQRQLQVAAPKMPLSRFVIMATVIGVTVLVIAMLFISSPVVPFCAGAAAWYVPFFMLGGRAKKRMRRISEQLPEALDFLSRILRAGHSLTTGLQMMGTELPDPLAGEFRKCYDQHSLGSPMEECLKEMADRIESTEFSFFVTAVLIQRTTGGDLSMVLGNISNTIRARMRLAGFLRAKTAEGRLTGYILVAFPILMFFIAYSLNPDYGGKLLHTSTGQKLLGTAVTLQILGLVTIKKLTNIKV
jgi:tight adherence protein B